MGEGGHGKEAVRVVGDEVSATRLVSSVRGGAQQISLHAREAREQRHADTRWRRGRSVTRRGFGAPHAAVVPESGGVSADEGAEWGRERGVRDRGQEGGVVQRLAGREDGQEGGRARATAVVRPPAADRLQARRRIGVRR